MSQDRLGSAQLIIGRGAAGGVGDLAGLAASLGWFDQAHVSRDFQAVTGTTPSAHLRRARAVQGTG
ncbi:hypothetical protein [Geodermatophilus sp. URMC 65]